MVKRLEGRIKPVVQARRVNLKRQYVYAFKTVLF